MRRNRTRWWRAVAAGAAALGVWASGLSASAASGTASPGHATSDRELSAPHSGQRSGGFEEIIDLIRLARTTAPFHNVQKALDAGWEVDPMCMDYPDGYYEEPPGAMGHHFYNADYILDGGHVDATQPEFLLYEKRPDGSWRLNAVEYIVPAADRPPTAPAPELFGRKFRFFPDVGQNGIWGLHVWIWRHNPHGLYANVNPKVTCKYSDAESPGHH